ncbi:amidohydrolase, partial [Bradyrhizobium sp. BRP05]|nr:amidohydrolase [Bradyrhizobium sp. BRP05]
VRPDLKVGDIATNEQTLFAGTCEVELTFVGTGGHAAFPHTANDALVAAAYFVTQVQTIVSRNVDPLDSAVVTFGKMEAGTTNNIIAERAFLHGTIRSLTQEVNELTQKRLTELAKGVAQSFDMTIDLKLKQGGYLPVENNPKLAKELMDFFRNETKANLIDIAPAMTGEDFGYLLSKIPGVMFWLGINSEAPLHSQKMQADEGVLDFAVEAIGQFLDIKANRN